MDNVAFPGRPPSGNSKAVAEGRAGHQSKRIAELERENSALKRQVKHLVARLDNLEKQKVEWESGKRELAALRMDMESLKASRVNLRARLFGQGSEKQEIELGDDEDSFLKHLRKRGQSPGSSGHGRRIHDEIDPQIVIHELSSQDRQCPLCGKLYEEIGIGEKSEEIDWDIVIRRRIHSRKRYRKSCNCLDVPAFLNAPVPPKLIPKGILSTGAVSHLLFEKYSLNRPISSSLKLIEMACGARIAQGSVTGILERVSPLLVPLYDAILERSRSSDSWHVDETGWKVFEDIESKKSHNWWLWVFSSADASAYILDPTRSKDVVSRHLQLDSDHVRCKKNVLSSDMYRAYMKLTGITNCYCWAHVRRHFLEASRGYPETLGVWAMEWIRRIGLLYKLNNERLDAETDSARNEAQTRLVSHMRNMEMLIDEQISDEKLHEMGKKVLYLVKRHWQGLCVFIDLPEVALDNNEAERALRGPVVGRKNFYGSGAVWSGNLAAMAFSIISTAQKNGLNPLSYLNAYLSECAHCGGKPPASIEQFLPWNISEENRQNWSRAPTSAY